MVLTLDDLRTQYGFSFPSSQELQYQAILDSAEEACARYIGFEEGEITEYFDSGSLFVLTHTPVLDVISVKSGSENLSYRYETRARAVVLSSVHSNVAVTYTCGWKNGVAPSLYKTAIAFTTQHLIKLSSSKLLGITSRTTEGGTETIEQSVPPLAVQKLLEPLRRNLVL